MFKRFRAAAVQVKRDRFLKESPMRDGRQSFAIFVLVAILPGALVAQPMPVTIDPTREIVHVRAQLVGADQTEAPCCGDHGTAMTKDAG
jgi:hypothetical protein